MDRQRNANWLASQVTGLNPTGFFFSYGVLWSTSSFTRLKTAILAYESPHKEFCGCGNAWNFLTECFLASQEGLCVMELVSGNGNTQHISKHMDRGRLSFDICRATKIAHIEMWLIVVVVRKKNWEFFLCNGAYRTSIKNRFRNTSSSFWIFLIIHTACINL